MLQAVLQNFLSGWGWRNPWCLHLSGLLLLDFLLHGLPFFIRPFLHLLIWMQLATFSIDLLEIIAQWFESVGSYGLPST